MLSALERQVLGRVSVLVNQAELAGVDSIRIEIPQGLLTQCTVLFRWPVRHVDDLGEDGVRLTLERRANRQDDELEPPLESPDER